MDGRRSILHQARKVIDAMARRPVVSVAFFAAAGLGLIAVLAAMVLDDLRYRTALESARSYSATLTAVREYYTSVVVPRARIGGLEVARDYHQRERAIPTPATMSIELGIWINDLVRPAEFRFFSGHPFDYRDDGGPRNAFEAEALERLVNNREPAFSRVVRDGDGLRLRHAEPVVMGAGCAACHNTHPDSPRDDWKAGDVRGVQAVSIALPPLFPSLSRVIDPSNPTFWPMLALLAGLAAICAVFLVLMRRLRRALDYARQRNRQLAQARIHAEAASEAKSRIMANVSHELRTPLNAIIGFSELMGSEAFGPMNNPKYLDYARDIKLSGERLMSFVENLIGFSEIESGAMELRREAVNLDQEVRRVVGLYEPVASEHGVFVRVEPTSAAPVLSVDRRAFRQIVGNLVANAVQYAGPRAIVSIRIFGDAMEAGVIIADDGVGIAKAELRRLLQPFERAGDPRFANVDGIGLGLPIARELAAMHGGSIWIDSAPGKGLTARVTFPPDCIIGHAADDGEARTRRGRRSVS
ncbi:MAG: hypothetical protein TEF_07955 [Rhizobiales bacterium NRL2]|nr:MAG: hypothetical protein TEF_07955 [Rhizobiales bacterium NRL2]